MIYADPSFLCSLYGWDDNTERAQEAFAADARRPLLYTPWQRFEVRNAFRLAVHKLRRAGQVVPFQPGNVFRRLDADVSAGRLRHQEPDWRETLRLADEISGQHTQDLGAASVDLWHVASAVLLRADTFWTFDEDQRRLANAVAVGRFRSVPQFGT